MGKLNVMPRTIFCRDNIDVLRGINTGCIDLIYLDPPFNKKKVFTAPLGSSAEGAAFSDIFKAKDIKDEWVKSIEYETPELHAYLVSVKTFSNQYNYCYLVYMAIRIIECHRILKDRGSLYLHCDPTMSHYLKIVMDCIFGEKNFRNEIVWGYRTQGVSMKWWPRKHDIIFLYAKSAEYTYHPAKERQIYQKPFRHTKRDAAGRYYVDSYLRDIWDHDDTKPVISQSSERTGYPTQKPLALLERIITASSNKGDMVLDPFCGCATTCVAAEKLGRQWLGVDVSHQAYELVNQRLEVLYAEQSENSLTTPVLSGGYTQAHYTTKVPVRGKEERQEQGYVYVIGNHSWPNIYKVGIAKDPKRRLNSYQTSDPYRAYTLCYAQRTAFYKEIEQEVHNQLAATNEWIAGDVNEIIAAIKKLARRHR